MLAGVDGGARPDGGARRPLGAVLTAPPDDVRPHDIRRLEPQLDLGEDPPAAGTATPSLSLKRGTNRRHDARLRVAVLTTRRGFSCQLTRDELVKALVLRDGPEIIEGGSASDWLAHEEGIGKGLLVYVGRRLRASGRPRPRYTRAMANRDVERITNKAQFIATLRRVADALEQGEPLRVQVQNLRLTVPADAELSVEHEIEGDSEELELQLRWSAA